MSNETTITAWQELQHGESVVVRKETATAEVQFVGKIDGVSDSDSFFLIESDGTPTVITKADGWTVLRRSS